MRNYFRVGGTTVFFDDASASDVRTAYREAKAIQAAQGTGRIILFRPFPRPEGMQSTKNMLAHLVGFNSVQEIEEGEGTLDDITEHLSDRARHIALYARRGG